MYINRFSHIPRTKYRIISNGYDEEDFAEAELQGKIRQLQQGPAVLVHSGVLYPSERDPQQFFNALADLRQAGLISPASVRVVLRATGHDEIYRSKLRSMALEDIVCLEPALPHREALIEMLNADGLLIFQAANCNWQIPAKVYECLRARRPIFAMTGVDGDTASVLRAEGMDNIAPLDSKQHIAEGLMKFLAQLNNGTSTVSLEPSHHSRRARTRELATLLQELVCLDATPQRHDTHIHTTHCF